MTDPLRSNIVSEHVTFHPSGEGGGWGRISGAKVSHISLDLWLTLIRSNPDFKPARIRLLRDFFGLRQDGAVVAAAFREHDRLFNTVNELTGRNLSYREMLLILLGHLGEDIAAISAARLEEFYAATEELFFSHPPVWLDAALPDLIFTLQEEGCTFSILSNTAFILGKTLRRFVARSPLADVFSFQLYSDEMEASKPHCSVYEKVFAGVNALRQVARSGILHIGDNRIADVEGAAAFGFQSALLQPHQQLSDLLKPLLCTPALPLIP